jgi:hypothetical protein
MSKSTMRHFEGRTFPGIEFDSYRRGSAKRYSRSMASFFSADRIIGFLFWENMP